MVMSLVKASSSVSMVGLWVSTVVDSVIRRSASSIKPRPIKTRPTRPAVVSWREMNITTPTKINSGDSHDKSSEKTTAITLVPTSAPSITASAAVRETMPWPTNDETISAVAVLDCTMAVTPIPESTALSRLLTPREINWRKFAPKTRKTPVRTSWVPQTKRAIAAKRFSKCFMDARQRSLGIYAAYSNVVRFRGNNARQGAICIQGVPVGIKKAGFVPALRGEGPRPLQVTARLARRARKISSRIRLAAPTQMAISATLKAG